MSKLIEALNDLRRQADNIDREMVSQIKDKGTYTEVTRQLGKIDDIISNILFDIGKSEHEECAEEVKAEMKRKINQYIGSVIK